MGFSYGEILVQSVNNDLQLLNFDPTVVKKILKIIKKTSVKIFEVLHFYRDKNIKIFIFKNNTVFSLIFYQKNIERHLRAVFIYCICRLEKIKILYWSNKYKFTYFTFRNSFTGIEVNFLQIYDKILTDYSYQIFTELNYSFISHSNRFLRYLKFKKNLLLILNTFEIKFLKKKFHYFLPKIGIEKLIALGFIMNKN